MIAIMEHTAYDGSPKLLRPCTLSLTGTRVVQRVITDLCELDVTPTGFEVIELGDGVTQEHVKQQSEAYIRFSSAVMQP